MIHRRIQTLDSIIEQKRMNNSASAQAGNGYGKMSVDINAHIALIYDIAPVYTAVIDGEVVNATSLEALLTKIGDALHAVLQEPNP